jgi:hypothetical protein
VACRLLGWPPGYPCIYAICGILGFQGSFSLQVVSLLILLCIYCVASDFPGVGGLLHSWCSWLYAAASILFLMLEPSV